MNRATLNGAAMIVAAMTVIGMADTLIPRLSQDGGLWQFHLLRSLMALPLLAAAVWWMGWRWRPVRPGMVALRTLCGASSMLIYFGCLGFLPIAQVGAGLFTSPIFVLLFSGLLFGRPISRRQVAAVILGFAGVLVMLRPDPSNLSALIFLPVLAGAIYGLSAVITREWCRDEPAALLLGCFFAALGLAGAVMLAVLAVWPVADPDFATRGWEAPTPVFLGITALEATVSVVGVGMMIRAYQLGETATLAVFEYSFLVAAVAFAWAVLGVPVTVADLAGIAMIIGSGAALARPGRRAVAAE